MNVVFGLGLLVVAIALIAWREHNRLKADFLKLKQALKNANIYGLDT